LITYLLGSSTASEIVDEVKKRAQGKNKILVILDSDHSKEHVLGELRAYSPLVNVGSYVIVEDTNVNGHPVAKSFGPGPMEAAEAFLKENSFFSVDKSKEKFYLTFNPSGYLKRIK
jgi:cephalosporin hydroxylase